MDFTLPAHDAFEHAIKRRVLSDKPQAQNYAGKYMYMGRNERGHNFKHINTREYLFCAA